MVASWAAWRVAKLEKTTAVSLAETTVVARVVKSVAWKAASKAACLVA